jgi:hypothetical protein
MPEEYDENQEDENQENENQENENQRNLKNLVKIIIDNKIDEEKIEGIEITDKQTLTKDKKLIIDMINLLIKYVS